MSNIHLTLLMDFLAFGYQAIFIGTELYGRGAHCVSFLPTKLKRSCFSKSVNIGAYDQDSTVITAQA